MRLPSLPSLLLLSLLGNAVAASSSVTSTLPVARPVIIGHRGAAGYLPDHTLEGYALAIDCGVDFIEPDLVSTKDGVLVARHEPNIVDTTDVASRPEFASRRRTVKVDGSPMEGFFVSDFTLAELKTLRAVQPFPERDQSFNGQFEIPTLDEIIALTQSRAKQLNRVVGIYPETKHPTYHRALGLPLEEKLLAALDKAGWNHADAPVVIQSFEQSNLQKLRNQTKVPLAQLVDEGLINSTSGAQLGGTRPYDWTLAGRKDYYSYMVSATGLQEIARYADIVAPYKRYLVTTIGAQFTNDGAVVDSNNDTKISDADYTLTVNTQVFADAHAAGLKIHAFTFRDEPYRLAVDYHNDPTQEYLQFFELGVDGVFSDNCKTAVPARDLFLKQNNRTEEPPQNQTNQTNGETHAPQSHAGRTGGGGAMGVVVLLLVRQLLA